MRVMKMRVMKKMMRIRIMIRMRIRMKMGIMMRMRIRRGLCGTEEANDKEREICAFVCT